MSRQTLPDWLLKTLRCPVTHSKLTIDGDHLVSEIGQLRYPIRDGIPALLPDEAILPAGIASMDEFKKQFPPRADA